MSDGKYYWLKLKCDFFKRHDIRIIQGMDNGREIVLFYIKLLLESIDHEGALRFSEEKPYTNGMLATLLETPLDIVELAMNTLSDFGLVKISEDKTIFLPKLASMVGYETEWARQKKEYRERKGQSKDNEKTNKGQCPDNVQTMSDKRIEIEKEIEKELEIEKDISFSGEKTKKFEPPTVEEVYEYCESRHNGIDAQLFVDYNTARGWRGIKDWKALIRVWENNPNTYRKDTES